MASNIPVNPNLPTGTTPPPSPRNCPPGYTYNGVQGCVPNPPLAPPGQNCAGGKLWNQYTGTCICPGDTHEENGICKPGPVQTTTPQGDCPPGQHHGGGHPGNPCLPDKPGAAPSAPGPAAPIEHSEGDMQDLLYTMFLDRLGGFQLTEGLGTDIPGFNSTSPDVLNLPGGGIASGFLPQGLTQSPFTAYEPPPTSALDIVNQLARKRLGAGGTPTSGAGSGPVHGGPAGVGGSTNSPLYPPVIPPAYKPPVKSSYAGGQRYF